MGIILTFVKILPVKRLLFIRFSSIGDIVLTTPVLRTVKRQVENAEIHFLTKKAFEPVIRANPNIDRIFTVEKEIGEVLPALANKRYDEIIDLHKNFRSYGVRSKLKKKAHSFPKLNFEKWLLVQFKVNRLPGIHIVDRYFEAVKHLGVRNDGEGLDHFIPAEDRVDPSALLKNFDKQYVAFVIGAKHATKALPEEKIVEICGKLDMNILLLGGHEDREKGDRIAHTFMHRVVNCCGKFNINQSASLISQASLVITHDTGLMHIAAAFGRNIISVWGNTVPEFGMYPYLPAGEGRSEIFQVKGLSCRPCSKIGFEKCPKGHFDCMMKISVDEIVANAGKLLAE